MHACSYRVHDARGLTCTEFELAGKNYANLKLCTWACSYVKVLESTAATGSKLNSIIYMFLGRN